MHRYSPIDTSKFKPNKDIHSEKDLEKEIVEISGILQDNCKLFLKYINIKGLFLLIDLYSAHLQLESIS